MPWRYLARNPDAAASALEVETGDHRAYSLSKPHPWRQKRADDPEYFKYYKSRYGAAESEADGWFTAACGPMIYQDSVLPGLHGQYFVCEPAGNLIHRALIEPDGAALKVRRAPGEEKSECAASRDAWSHPMNLTHGPDGAIYVVDYYREIIEDYSAIPRHLQQQYGVYAGHDRGRIYRLTHRELPSPPAADMSALDAAALVRECASTRHWRRLTAQRMLAERNEKAAVPALRELLTEPRAKPSTIIATLRTLDGLGALLPADVQPFFTHAESSVRIHALQLGDRWFVHEEGRALLDAALAAAAEEADARVRIQFALSLGEARDPRALAQLARYARTQLDLRWMDAALLSSLHGRGGEMLADLLREPGGSAPLLEPLAKSIAARRNEAEIALALTFAAGAPPAVETALQKAPPKVRKAASGESPAPDSPPSDTPPALEVSDETFRKYVAALTGPRYAKRGHEVFTQSCAVCHRIGEEGHVFGPDLPGQLGIAEESLLKDILRPNAHIRPGYETTLVEGTDGAPAVGLVKEDGATSLTLLAPGGIEQVLLRKDIAAARRRPTSLMPSFAEAITPAGRANLLAWLRSQLGAR